MDHLMNPINNPEGILKHVVDHVPSDEWRPTILYPDVQVWPPIKTGMPVVIARVRADQVSRLYNEYIARLYGLLLYGPLANDGMVYYLTENMINSLPEPSVQ